MGLTEVCDILSTNLDATALPQVTDASVAYMCLGGFVVAVSPSSFLFFILSDSKYVIF